GLQVGGVAEPLQQLGWEGRSLGERRGAGGGASGGPVLAVVADVQVGAALPHVDQVPVGGAPAHGVGGPGGRSHGAVGLLVGVQAAAGAGLAAAWGGAGDARWAA